MILSTKFEVSVSFDDLSETSTKVQHDSLDLSLDTSFKLSCTFEEEKTPAIHRAILLFTAGNTYSYPVPIRIRKSKGNYALRLEYDFAKAPLEFLLLSTSPSKDTQYALHVSSLHVKSLSEQLVLPLGSFQFTSSVATVAQEEAEAVKSKVAKEWEIKKFEKQEDREWQNKPMETGLPVIIGILGSIVVVVLPLVFLAFLVCISKSRRKEP